MISWKSIMGFDKYFHMKIVNFLRMKYTNYLSAWYSHCFYTIFHMKRKSDKKYAYDLSLCMYDDVSKPIVIGPLSDSGNLQCNNIYVVEITLWENEVCSHWTCILDKQQAEIHRQHNLYILNNFYHFRQTSELERLRICCAQVGILLNAYL